MSLRNIGLAIGSSLRIGVAASPRAATAQAAIDRISRMKPRIMASRPETSMTPSRRDVEQRDRHGSLSAAALRGGESGSVGESGSAAPRLTGADTGSARALIIQPNGFISCRFRAAASGRILRAPCIARRSRGRHPSCRRSSGRRWFGGFRRGRRCRRPRLARLPTSVSLRRRIAGLGARRLRDDGAGKAELWPPP